MKLILTKDSHGYIASIEGQDHIFAHGSTPDEAKKELICVLEMMLEYHSSLVEQETLMKDIVTNS